MSFPGLPNLLALAALVVATVGAPLGVGLLLGVDRRVTAAMQLRAGPPILQPWYDLTKLATKTSLPVDRLAASLLVAHAVLAAGAVALVLAGGDLIAAVLVMGAARVLFILAAGAVESPYAQLGASRELILLLISEPLLLLVAIAYGGVAGSFSAAAVAAARAPVLTLPTLGLTLGVLLAIALRKSPFDLATSHHAHQELVKGSTTEMAGFWLALAEVGHWYETAFVLVLIALASLVVPLVGIGLVAATYTVAIVADNTLPRATWRSALWIGWGIGGTAAVIALVTGRLLGAGGT
jgi:formate hydrogenlyase subunit 4